MDIGPSPRAVGWFDNYLSDRKQRVHFEGSLSMLLSVSSGVHVDALGRNVPNAKFHFLW